MNLNLNLIRLFLALVVSFLSATSAIGCTCADLTIQQQRENANVIFFGTVIKKLRSNAVEKDGVQVTFKVSRVWKGVVKKALDVFTGATGDLYPFENLCASRFTLGQNYIVFALGQDKLSTDYALGQ